MSNSKAVFLAFLLACRAMAVPTDTIGKADIQAVIDTVKAQVELFNPAAASLVHDIQGQLLTNGVLSDDHITALNTKILTLSPNGVLNTTAIADTAIAYLNKNGAFDSTNPKDMEDKTITLTTEMINKVLQLPRLGVQDCPGGGRLCGGCVIL
ncbi:unnamed protein product [Discula destructiva]